MRIRVPKLRPFETPPTPNPGAMFNPAVPGSPRHKSCTGGVEHACCAPPPQACSCPPRTPIGQTGQLTAAVNMDQKSPRRPVHLHVPLPDQRLVIDVRIPQQLRARKEK